MSVSESLDEVELVPLDDRGISLTDSSLSGNGTMSSIDVLLVLTGTVKYKVQCG